MKLALASLALLALASLSSAQGGIRNSAHDFANKNWNQKPGEICGVCHIPHVEGRINSRTGNGLLWGRSLSAQTNYTLYSSPTLVGTIVQPQGSTKLCLGCHDGSVALEEHANFSGTGTNFISGGKKVPGLPSSGAGTDFSDTHPVSINYVAGTATNLRATTSTFGSGTIADALENGNVECRTCHDVHDKDVGTGANDLLRIRNDDTANPSALCLACHDK